jgi:hypothetical protein
MSIFSNSSHLEWRAGLSDIILKGTHQGTIPARFGLIWFSGFREEDLNVIFLSKEQLPSLFVRPSTFHILIFSSETAGPIATKLWWNGPWVAPLKNSNQDGHQAKNRKKGDDIFFP